MHNFNLKSKEQICHELAIEYARKEAFNDHDSTSLIAQFEDNEKLLCLYAWCYSDLMKRFDNILTRYTEMLEEKRMLREPLSKN